MLNKIKLTNFRKHVDAEFTFDSGLSALRGPNEGGKSTIIEAISYALFGIKACRTPLSDLVTWGEAEATLRVALQLTLEGTLYTITRGKSGAECLHGTDIVTGQSEVTNFICSKLRVDAGAAARLMLSNQSEIRGALEAGTKATTELIERLADFDQLDRLLDLMQEKLTLGSSATAQAQLDAAQQRLEKAQAVERPDFGRLQGSVEFHEGVLAIDQAQLDAAQQRHDAAQAELASASASASERASLKQRTDRLQARYTAAMTEMQTLKANPANEVANADERIQTLLAQQADVEAHTKRLAAYAAVKGVLGGGLKRFPGNASAFEAELKLFRANKDACRESLRKGDVQFAALQAKLSTGSCGFCGQDFSDLPSVKEQNTKIQAVMDGVSAGLAAAQKDLDHWTQEVEEYEAIQVGGKATLSAAQKYAQYLVIDTEQHPPSLAWSGEVPVEGDQPDYAAHIRVVRASVKAHTDWLQALKANDTLLGSFEPERNDIQSREKALGGAADIEALQTLANGARQALQEVRETVKLCTTAVSEAKGELAHATMSWEWAQKELGDAGAAVNVSREALLTLDFNNTLLKKVRAARPVIADRLWSLVLTAVSSYFSEMRGERSTVSKGPEGFTVDGHPVATLSGSTLDILGLAIRVALVRTFLPGAPFLVLDEPAAACDLERTEAMLGFLVGVGFNQILLVTHEDISESVADHIITLGE